MVYIPKETFDFHKLSKAGKRLNPYAQGHLKLQLTPY